MHWGGFNGGGKVFSASTAAKSVKIEQLASRLNAAG